MKLKLRLLVTLLAIVLVTFCVLNYLMKYILGSKSSKNWISLHNRKIYIAQQNESPRTSSLYRATTSSVSGNSNAELFDFLIKTPNKEPLRRRRKRKKKVFNETNIDSNQALEEPDNPLLDVVLDKKEISSLAKKTRSLAEPDPNVELRYFKECKGLSKGYKDNRKKYPDLVFISRNMKNSNPLRPRITLQDAEDLKPEKLLNSLHEFNLRISNLDMYEDNDTIVEDLLYGMETMSITHVTEKSGGTQLKLLVTFKDGSQAVLKPMRFKRSQKTNTNHFYFNDFERHTSEIATFHLDRILGFRRCVPVVGRVLSIAKDIFNFAEMDLLKTFFLSPGRNLCFHGNCKQYCDSSHAICGTPDTLEVSLAAFLPSEAWGERQKYRNPWRRSYNKRRKAEWENNPHYCDLVRQQPSFNNTKLLADIVDEAILDFLTGNMDRHHYEFFKAFGNDSFLLHLDNGRGFGKTKDEYSILAPLFQCCFLHQTTFLRLLQLQNGRSKLSTLMFCSLYNDPLTPVLLEDHLEALDRRLEIILNLISVCVQRRSLDEVFFKFGL